MTAPRRLPPPPPVPAEAREVSLTVPPPTRFRDRSSDCITCGEHEAVDVWDDRPGNRRGWTRCAACADLWREVCRAVDAEGGRYEPELEEPDRDADYFVDVVPY